MIHKWEAVVVGGGPGGICAALALARQGKHTALVTNRPVLGGNSSSEIRVWTRGATGGGNIYAEEMGIWGELKLRNLYMNVEANPVFWDDVLLEQVLEEPKLDLFLNTHVSEVRLEGSSRIRAVVAHQMGSEKEIEFEAQMFVDATGDGTLGYLSGVPSFTGKEDAGQYQESLAPEKSDKHTFGNTIFFFSRRTEKPVSYHAPSFAYSMEQVEQMLGKGGRIVNETMNGCDYWWFEMGGMKDTIADFQEITIDLKCLVTGVWNYIKNSGKYDADCLTLEWEGNLPGKRESRRMITERVLCQQDIQKQTKFADRAFYGGWYLDFHPSDGISAGEDFCVQIPVQVYPIPLRCLYNRKVGNLLFAGRNIGVSHVAFASTRIMNTCALSGQAAGTLATACMEEGCTPEELGKEQIDRIQQRLLEDDVLIPELSLDRDRNLAVQAQMEVSSEERCGTVQTAGSFWLGQGGYLVWPAEASEARFLIRAKNPTTLLYKQYLSALPSRLAYGEELGTGEISLKEGENWIAFPRPGVEAGFVTTVLKANPDVEFVTGAEEYPGFLLGQEDSPVFDNPCVRLGAEVYGKENLRNGETRLWRRPNLWMSAKEERPWVRLDWKEPVKVKEILVFFNPDLKMELVSSRADTWNEHHKYVARKEMPKSLVKEAALYGRTVDGAWKELAHVEQNWKRRWKIDLGQAEELQAIKMEIISTYGENRAEVFEIRVYE